MNNALYFLRSLLIATIIGGAFAGAVAIITVMDKPQVELDARAP